MPTKRNRKDSESSTSSIGGILENTGSINELQSPDDKDDDESSTSQDCAWERPCCCPSGCLDTIGKVNLTKPDEIEKVVCSNENCPVGPYMHKECFTRWEDSLLLNLRSHGRARSWSEKQRRQNLWTKRGYDLAYRACACLCKRGHLRKDLNWNPKDISTQNDMVLKETFEESTKKKNRKKHKDLPTLGNKYSFAVVRSKSKAIPNTSGKDGRGRTSSSSSSMSVDQGYSSSSPSYSDSHLPPGGGFFSPPQHPARGHMTNAYRVINRSTGLYFGGNPLYSHVSLPQIPDNDILEDFCGNKNEITQCYSGGHQPLDSHLLKSDFCQEKARNNLLQSASNGSESPNPHADDVIAIKNMFSSIHLSSQRQRCHSWSDPQDGKAQAQTCFKQESTSWSGKSAKSNKFFYPAVLDSVPELSSGHSFPIGHWGDVSPTKSESVWNSSQHSEANESQSCLQGFHEFPNSQAMLCSDIDLKQPKVIIVPGNNGPEGKRICTEITITPICNTTFLRRHDFSGLQCVLQSSQVNPYHIKMEGEGYGSDDFRNTILAILSRETCCQISCVACGKVLPIYDHFPLLDGTLFCSPVESPGSPHLKIDFENKSHNLYAVCVGCLDGVNNLLCVMCEQKWKGPVHQLGSMYMFDVFAAIPCCQNRLRCKQCGYGIVDINKGMKYFCQYSEKVSCPNCGNLDYHFVHPASTYKVLGPQIVSLIH